MTIHPVEPPTYKRRAASLTDTEIQAELAWLDGKWDALRDVLEESGGCSGSPGEWIFERQSELDAELRRRAVKVWES